MRYLAVGLLLSGCAGVLTPAPQVIEGESFALTVSAPANAAAGATFAVDVAITPIAPWKMTAGYPVKIAIAANASPGELTLKGEDLAQSDEEGIAGRASFRATQPGAAHVDVTVNFSLCTPDRCVPLEVSDRLAVEIR